MPYWRKEPVKTADKAASNHGISAMKFQVNFPDGREGGESGPGSRGGLLATLSRPPVHHGTVPPSGPRAEGQVRLCRSTHTDTHTFTPL